jgi:hypothetical protein
MDGYTPQELELVTAAIIAVALERPDQKVPLSRITRRLFELVDDGERDFAKLKRSALEMCCESAAG